ncbi:hypothetical protein KUM42_15385 [Modestobacter sp. L9-4]|uniref:hypothetical protein n=1 Tax=Modestobacter sp. L9-4 TaxID=2851567 RepID=UPI001C762385|nr:hypothetical protein [Modestobacter sp. L9-4]QXG75209.1 hypothetical protein KUM42_15385 [Modestobacter sp. L9-4]
MAQRDVRNDAVQQLAAYEALATAINAAPTVDAVRAAVAQAGLRIDREATSVDVLD